LPLITGRKGWKKRCQGVWVCSSTEEAGVSNRGSRNARVDTFVCVFPGRYLHTNTHPGKQCIPPPRHRRKSIPSNGRKRCLRVRFYLLPFQHLRSIHFFLLPTNHRPVAEKPNSSDIKWGTRECPRASSLQTCISNPVHNTHTHKFSFPLSSRRSIRDGVSSRNRQFLQ
jgi:hypothetical protein